MVCCLPGARAKDVTERLQDILKGEGEQAEVIVHIGTNDIGRKRDEDLKSEYRELGRRLKCRTSLVVISGQLPMPCASESRNRKIRQMNAWLESWCSGQGFRFVDHWDLFWGRADLFKRDGLHLN